MGEEEATLTHSIHRNSAGVNRRVILVKHNPTTDPAAFLLDGLAHLALGERKIAKVVLIQDGRNAQIW